MVKKKKVLIVFAFLVLITSYIVKIQYKMDCEKKVLEAKYRLNRIVEYQKEYYAKNRKYDVEYISVEKLKYLKIKQKPIYEIGTVETFPQYSEICNDCVMGSSKFRILAVGNLDKDNQQDVFTVNEKGELEHLVVDGFMPVWDWVLEKIKM
ncbi:MAG: hypothetical protein A2381_05495 [Bdellovibrionales bacterium RIFOXYB1_FULL_37_110]|nr:MAG: hypothetical protein A2328_04300 [Bdellovibrionales bacterium RIFOXYB2_FULL_36_6]OFZ60594.1 MAG: hypothetical protein A2381_05495 [Bdellovibrionales bacterium RIFOXYB1_FULL_37_110]